MDPIHQFQIINLFPIAKIGNTEIAFTNSALYMLIALGVIALLMLGATGPRALVPGRLQSVAEMSYEFVANTLRSSAGSEGMRFFPLVFSLFMFILVLNVDRDHPLHLHGDEPHHHHGLARAARLPHRDHLRLLAATACISSSCSCRAASRSTSCRW